MALCVMAETLLAKSRHRIEGDSVTVHFSVLLCENAEGDDEFVYWVLLLESVGEVVMKEIANDFISAHDIYTRLKITLGPEHSQPSPIFSIARYQTRTRGFSCFPLHQIRFRIIPILMNGDRDMKKALFGAALAFALSGCVYVGNNFDENKLANVQKGVTTKQEVISYFGEPSTSTVDSDGNETMMWTYSISNGFGGADAKVLSIKTHDGKVENYAVSRSKF